MKNGISLLLLLTLAVFMAKAQSKSSERENEIFGSKGEIIIAFAKPANMHDISRMISIDKVSKDSVVAYCNSTELTNFKKLGIPYSIKPSPFEIQQVDMASDMESFLQNNWNAYPTYPQYDSMMHYYANTYPSLCKFVTLGTLTSGRQILALKISKNVNVQEKEPRFLYTSSMHGDEITGYVMMLRLADYLLGNYGTDAKVTRMLDNMEIWINPLANPDGTYHGGNNTVNFATRYNANNIDYNRNFPDPQDGQHPDGNAWQPETQIFMHFADSLQFTMSANFHGGAEVVNYPWDTWTKLPADVNWWKRVSKQFADSVQFYGPNSYFTDTDPTGYINGYTWYTISGGRQDYMNYFHRCREVTIEISETKNPAGSQLPNYWNYLNRSILNYLNQCTYSLHGTVSDSLTGNALKAKIYINGFDKDSSHVYTSDSGDYYRLLNQGNYSVTFSSDGYRSKTLSVNMINDSANYLDVQLVPIGYGIEESQKSGLIEIFPNPSRDYLNIKNKSNLSIEQISILSFTGQQIHCESAQNLVDIRNLNAGIYNLEISLKDGQRIYKTFIKE